MAIKPVMSSSNVFFSATLVRETSVHVQGSRKYYLMGLKLSLSTGNAE